MAPLALVVLFTCIVAPICQLLALVYVLGPLQRGQQAPHARIVYRFIRWIKPWAMLEVFMLGLLVSLVKLGGIAELGLGLGLWALAALVPLFAAIEVNLDARDVWLGGKT